MRPTIGRTTRVGLLLATALAWAQPGAARVKPGDAEYQDFQAYEQEMRAQVASGGRIQRPADVPDIYGPGAVLTVGRVFMKCTNVGLDGNGFPQYSSDPGGQWPGASAVEYLSYIGYAVGAVNPFATDPTAVRRVSFITEWRPATLDPVDRMYQSYDGIVNGVRFKNDDGDSDPLTGEPRIDEEYLDGRDNDGDGVVDEDFAALGQQMFTCYMRDDTPQAVNSAGAERHVPLGLEMWKSNWAYSISGYTDFNVIQLDIYNRSGHMLDSVVIGMRDDMDAGPIEQSSYWSDDYNLPFYPHGDFLIQTSDKDKRLQPANDHTAVVGASSDSALCPRFKVRVQGWSTVDDDGDGGKTPGVATIMLLDHTIDPTGANGPSKVGIRAFRSYVGGTPYGDGGFPPIDQQKYEFMTSRENIDLETGFVNLTTGEQKGDYGEYVSIGPWRNLPDGGHLQATFAFGVATGTYLLAQKYNADYDRAVNAAAGAVPDPSALASKYPTLANALAAQIAFDGVYESRVWPWLTDSYGRETPVKAPPGQILYLNGCSDRDPDPRPVNDRQYSWFDFDCDYCTGAFSKSLQQGFFHRTWLAGSPPPSPLTNMSAAYNFSDNPNRRFVPAGDRQVTIAWDNLSETTPDPKTNEFDFRGYRVWKVSNWQRPVGAGGPYEDDWTLLAEYRLFDSRPTNAVGPCPPELIGPDKPCAAVGDTLWPVVFIPQLNTFRELRLYSGDLWDRQSGIILRPDASVRCVGWPNCAEASGSQLGLGGASHITRTIYPVGRWHVVDTQVKNGFVYFYGLSAFDSTSDGTLSSQRSAVEADGVVPQSGADTVSSGAHVWVVPNPYRGERQIKARPSAWDLTPNASDPTGTHVDFLGLPRGDWRIKIFTVSGDLVVELGARDAVNESIRPPVADASGTFSRPGYNRQQDNPNDGQARWNLISRNGQDVVSGIYLFTVELGGAVKHRGKFVIIR